MPQKDQDSDMDSFSSQLFPGKGDLVNADRHTSKRKVIGGVNDDAFDGESVSQWEDSKSPNRAHRV